MSWLNFYYCLVLVVLNILFNTAFSIFQYYMHFIRKFLITYQNKYTQSKWYWIGHKYVQVICKLFRSSSDENLCFDLLFWFHSRWTLVLVEDISLSEIPQMKTCLLICVVFNWEPGVTPSWLEKWKRGDKLLYVFQYKQAQKLVQVDELDLSL